MIQVIVDTIAWIAREKYEADKALYHYDFKICLYGLYMEVMNGVGDLLQMEGKKR